MIDLQTLSIVLASMSVCVAAIYYTFTLRYTRMNMKNTLETRQAQLYMGLINTLRSPEFRKQWHITEAATWKDFDDFNEKYSPEKNPEVLTAFTSLFTFFESVGTLVKKKLIDISLVDGFLAISIIGTWKRYEPILMGDREYFQRPYLWGDFEYIYNEIKKREQHPEIKT